MTATPMISEARAAAARANGAKSRGPVTAQGKANSSRNSRKHGLRSRILFPDYRSDDSFLDRLAAYTECIQPRSATERSIVETLAIVDSRQLWLYNLEKNILQNEMRRVESLAPRDNPTATLAQAFRNLADHSRVLDRLHSLDEALFDRYVRTVNRLHAFRACRRESQQSEFAQTNPPNC